MNEEQLKELIAEMEAREVHFVNNIVNVFDLVYEKNYWKGKLSETKFVIEKLKEILNK